MAGPGLWPFVISGASGAVSGAMALAGVVLTLRRSERNELTRSHRAEAAAVAAEGHRLEQENLLELQLSLAELADQTQGMAANIMAKGDVARVSVEFRFQWVATRRHAGVLAERILDDELRGKVKAVIERLGTAPLPGDAVTRSQLQEGVDAALAVAEHVQQTLGAVIRSDLSRPAVGLGATQAGGQPG